MHAFNQSFNQCMKPVDSACIINSIYLFYIHLLLYIAIEELLTDSSFSIKSFDTIYTYTV